MLIPEDELDDAILEAGAGGFVAMDETTKATLLAETTLQCAINSLCRPDGIVGPRPGLRHVGRAVTAGLANGYDTQAALFFGTAGTQGLLLLRAGVLSWLQSLDESIPTQLATGYATSRSVAAQLVNSAVFTKSDGGLLWATYGETGWTSGVVAAWADGSSMPIFGAICTHGYRMLASPVGTDEIYASAVMQATTPADWSRTVQIRVGEGRADPIVVMLSGQDSFLHVLKGSSVWRIDMSTPSAGDWMIARLTDKCGCVAARSAVQINQDTIFLSRAGVVSLSALTTTDSLSEASVISAPIESTIRRINWNAASSIVAEAWGQYYLLALPLDSDAAPRDVMVWDVVRRAWVGHWRIALPDAAAVAPGIGALLGTAFGNVPELVAIDNSGHARRFEQSSVVDELDRVDGVATTQDVVQKIRTRAWDFGAPDNRKSFINLVAEFWDSSSGSTHVYVVRDGKDPELVAGPIRSSSDPQFPIGFPLAFQRDRSLSRAFSLRRFGRAREIAVELAETTGQLAVRRVQLSAFLDSAEVQR